MTLYEYMNTNTDDEVTVFDKDYDLETYFYKVSLSDADEWDKAMIELSKLLEVVSTSKYGVTVNLADLIESKLDKLGDWFYETDLDLIMEDIDRILAGNVSETWLTGFVDALKEND